MKKKSVKAKLKKLMIGVLSAVVIAGTVSGLSDVAKADANMAPKNATNEDGKLIVESVNVGSPYSYSVFTRTFASGNHIEGTVAAKEVSFGLQIYGYAPAQEGYSRVYIADTNGDLKFQDYDTELVIGDKLSTFSGIDLEQVVAGRFASSSAKLTSYTIADTAYMNQSIEDAFSALADQSASYKTMTTDEAAGRIVYYLTDGSQINDSLVQEIQAYAEADKQVIVNVGGTIVSDSKNWNGPAYAWWANNIIWNFYDATEVYLNNNTYGTIYALNATVHNVNWIVGRVFCNEFRQNGEVHAPHPGEKPDIPKEEPSPSPEPSEEPSPSPEPSEEPSPSPSPSEEPSPSPSPSPSEEPSPSPSPSEEPSPSPSPSPSEEPSPSPSEEPSPSPSPSEEPSPSPSEEPSPSPSPSEEPSPTPTPVTTPTPTPTPVVTPTPTPTPTQTPTPTPIQTPTPTPYTPEYTVTTVSTPDVPETPQVLGRKRPRIVTIDDEATPLAGGFVLGADRRPQTSDESDLWTVAFLASLSGLAAWLLAGKKKA